VCFTCSRRLRAVGHPIHCDPVAAVGWRVLRCLFAKSIGYTNISLFEISVLHSNP
jgi:hypothetical protein